MEMDRSVLFGTYQSISSVNFPHIPIITNRIGRSMDGKKRREKKEIRRESFSFLISHSATYQYFLLSVFTKI